MSLEETSNHVWTECERNTSIVLRPSSDVLVRVRPQQIAQEPCRSTRENKESRGRVSFERRITKEARASQRKKKEGRELETYRYQAHPWVASLDESDPSIADPVTVLRALQARARTERGFSECSSSRDELATERSCRGESTHCRRSSRR